MIPNTEFITTFLNIRDSDLEYFFVSTENGKTYYNVQLKRKLFSCPYCRCETIGYGHRMKTIYHPVLRDTNGYIKYNAKAAARFPWSPILLHSLNSIHHTCFWMKL